MFSKESYILRRAELQRRIGKGVILLLGNADAPFNYPNNAYAFRQDSTFLYYFGLNMPSLAAVIDIDENRTILFGDDLTVDDIIWTGPQPSLAELAEGVGVTESKPFAALRDYCHQTLAAKRTLHYLPPYRGESKILLSTLVGQPIEALHSGISLDLMFAVAEMREVKSEEELEALERAFHIGYEMHTTAMRMCREGVIEREIAGVMEGVARRDGLGCSFPTIATQHGETLHNLRSDGRLESGRLMLVDAGAESLEHYCSDHTRTYPVNGKFTSRQRDIYNIVLRAQQEAPAAMRTGAMYFEDVHKRALRMLAEGLNDIGLITASAEDAVEAGAMSLFMPHGLSHGLGMDVHDCEAIGERSFDFTPFRERAEASATCIYRAAWRLHEGTVMSNEPGIYFIPALIDKCRAEGLYKGIVNYAKLEEYRDFGGIRIEDDIIVTNEGGRIIGSRRLPITVEELEAIVGK
ncbi:MAG: aminopeptidase P N-terminal domain-containing protein [Alistipes sp.]|nr:aminopeptidase P N-terminal domain-containing protein [Alistipes sp.]